MDGEQEKKFKQTCLCEGIFDLFLNGYNPNKNYDQQLMNGWAVVRITLGNLLVRGYRIFKRLKVHKCLIFCKTQGLQTKYLYFKVATHFINLLTPSFFTGFNLAIDEINNLKQKAAHKYSIVICYTLEKCYLQLFSSPTLQKKILNNSEWVTKDKMVQIIKQYETQTLLHPIVYSFKPGIVQERQLLQDSQDQFKKLKDILYHYIDTFGQKYKTNYYKDLQKKCLTSYNITNLINTINIIIYQETKQTKKIGGTGPMYSQIESSVWTAFNKNKNQLESDRKDIVLSGSGRVLIIDIIFMKDLKKYIQSQQYKGEVRQVLQEYNKSHIEGRVKVVKISNELNMSSGYGLSYNIESAQLNGFNKIDRRG